MRDFSEYKKDLKSINIRDGLKIFKQQLKTLEGENVIIDDGLPTRCLVINSDNIYNEKKEFRTLCMLKEEKCEHGSYVQYQGDTYIVVTDIDDHYYYKSCKMRKCNNTLKWKQNGNIYEYACVLANDSYGVKVLSDNDYIRSQNIKAQVTVKSDSVTKKLVPDMRFMFNHSQFDIYNVVDVNTSIVEGIITLTMEKSVYQNEDDLVNNLAFSQINVDSNDKQEVETPSVPSTCDIIGEDKFKQLQESTFKIEPLRPCKFYIEDFESQYIANIIEDNGNGECKVFGKKNISNNSFTLIAMDEESNILAQKIIWVMR